MVKSKILKWVFLALSLLVTCLVIIVILAIVTDTNDYQKTQGDQLYPEQKTQNVKEKDKSNDQVEIDIENIGLDKEVNPFPNDSFPHAGLTDETFEKYVTLMENDDEEITKERVEWLIEGLDVVSEESRSGFKERINSLEDKVQ